jgi:hypothetical protein
VKEAKMPSANGNGKAPEAAAKPSRKPVRKAPRKVARAK